jgi:hypothetical protein
MIMTTKRIPDDHAITTSHNNSLQRTALRAAADAER